MPKIDDNTLARRRSMPLSMALGTRKITVPNDNTADESIKTGYDLMTGYSHKMLFREVLSKNDLMHPLMRLQIAT